MGCPGKGLSRARLRPLSFLSAMTRFLDKRTAVQSVVFARPLS